MFDLCDHPDPRASVRAIMQGIRRDGRFIGYVCNGPGNTAKISLICWTHEEGKAEVARFVEAETGRKVELVTTIPNMEAKTEGGNQTKAQEAGGPDLGQWFDQQNG